MPVTLHDVAREAGVSIKTVSNVVRGQGRFGDETRQRVEAAVERLGYHPNLAARGLRSGRLGVIGLIVPDIRNPYFAELADAVMRAAAEHDLLVVLEQSDGDPDTELELLRGSRTRIVDGILFSVLGLGAGDERLGADISTPVVVLGEPIPGWDTDWVSMRHLEGAAAATEHLVQSGRRRIAAIGARQEERVGSASLRLAGYRRALAAAGIEVDETLIEREPIWGRSQGADAVGRLLEAGREFDGLVAFNDALALGALRALEDSGLRVPDDVAVIGFDDIDETRYTRPTLSTVRPEIPDLATTAVGYLLRRIEAGAGPGGEVRGHRAACALLVRDSSAA